MAYSTKYIIKWAEEGTGHHWRLRIRQDGYAGDPSTLTPARAAFRLQGQFTSGQTSGEAINLPCFIQRGEIAVVRTGGALQEVFGAEDDEYKVFLDQSTDGGVTYDLRVWRGYVRTDKYQDNPHRDEVVRLGVHDGLALLRNQEYETFGGLATLFSETVLLQQIADILQGTGLTSGIELSQLWRPHLENPPSGDWQPLEHLAASFEAFASNDPVSKLSVLKQQLGRFGLSLRQAKGQWWITQRSEMPNGQPLTWPYSGQGLSTGDARVVDLRKDLSQMDVTENPEPNRPFVPRLSESSVSYEFGESALDQVILNGSFEQGLDGTWQVTDQNTGTTSDDPSAKDAYRVRYVDITERPTQEDRWLVKVEDDTDPSVARDPQLVQDVGTILHGTAAGIFHFSAKQTGFPLQFDLQVGSDRLYHAETAITGGVTESETDEGELEIDPFDAGSSDIIAPAGTELPISHLGTDVGTITLSKPLRGGDERALGKIRRNQFVPQDLEGNYFRLHVWNFKDASSFASDYRGIRLRPWNDDDDLREEQSVAIPSRKPGGEIVGGDVVVRVTLSGNNAGVLEGAFLDHIGLSFSEDGQPVTSMGVAARQDKNGLQRSETYRIGDGPTPTATRRLRIKDAAGTVHHITGDWKRAPYTDGENPSGVGLNQLHVTERMRQRIAPSERREMQIRLRAGQDLWPHHVLDIGGDYYDLTYWERDFTSGIVTVKATNLEPSDPSNLRYDFYQEGSAQLRAVELQEGLANLQATLDERTEALAVGDAFAVVADTLSGDVAEIPLSESVEQTHDALRAGNHVTIAGLQGHYWTFEIADAVEGGDDFIKVTSQNLGGKVIPQGSGVFVTQGDLVSVQTQTRQAIGEYLTGASVATLSAQVQGDVSSLPVDPVARDIREGEDLSIVKLDGQSTVEVQVSQDVDMGARSIPIAPQYVDAPEGSRIVSDDVMFGSERTMTPAEVRQIVEEERVSGAFTKLTAPASGTSVTSLDVEALPADLEADTNILALADARTEIVQLDQPASQGDTTLSIYGEELDLPAGTTLHLRGSDQQTQYLQNKGEIALSATQSQVQNYVAGQTGANVVTKVTAGVTSATTIPVQPLSGTIPARAQLRITWKEDVPKRDLPLFQMETPTLAQKATKDDTSIEVDSAISVPDGAQVFYDAADQLERVSVAEQDVAEVSVQADAIENTVTKERSGDAVGVLASAASGSTVTSLQLDSGLPVALEEGWKLNVADAADAWVVTVASGGAMQGDSTIPIDPKTMDADVGATVRVTDLEAFGQVRTIAGEVVMKASANGDGTHSLALVKVEADVSQGSGVLIQGADIELDGNTTVRGDFEVTGDAVVGGTMDTSQVTVATGDGNTKLDGGGLVMVALSAYQESSALTWEDQGSVVARIWGEGTGRVNIRGGPTDVESLATGTLTAFGGGTGGASISNPAGGDYKIGVYGSDGDGSATLEVHAGGAGNDDATIDLSSTGSGSAAVNFNGTALSTAVENSVRRLFFGGDRIAKHHIGTSDPPASGTGKIGDTAEGTATTPPKLYFKTQVDGWVEIWSG